LAAGHRRLPGYANEDWVPDACFPLDRRAVAWARVDGGRTRSFATPRRGGRADCTTSARAVSAPAQSRSHGVWHGGKAFRPIDRTAT